MGIELTPEMKIAKEVEALKSVNRSISVSADVADLIPGRFHGLVPGLRHTIGIDHFDLSDDSSNAHIVPIEEDFLDGRGYPLVFVLSTA